MFWNKKKTPQKAAPKASQPTRISTPISDRRFDHSSSDAVTNAILYSHLLNSHSEDSNNSYESPSDSGSSDSGSCGSDGGCCCGGGD